MVKEEWRGYEKANQGGLLGGSGAWAEEWRTRRSWCVVKQDKGRDWRSVVRGQQVPGPAMKIMECSFWVLNGAQMLTAELPRGRG